MIIECINCNKKFEVDRGLIPEKGRIIQCGSCNHQWFFKENKKDDTKNNPLKLEIPREETKAEIIINENNNYQKKQKKIYQQ